MKSTSDTLYTADGRNAYRVTLQRRLLKWCWRTHFWSDAAGWRMVREDWYNNYSSARRAFDAEVVGLLAEGCHRIGEPTATVI